MTRKNKKKIFTYTQRWGEGREGTLKLKKSWGYLRNRSPVQIRIFDLHTITSKKHELPLPSYIIYGRRFSYKKENNIFIIIIIIIFNNEIY